MMCVEEAAACIIGRNASVGEIMTMSDCLKEGLVQLGVSEFAEWGFTGPRVRQIGTVDECIEHMLRKYMGEKVYLGDVLFMKEYVAKGCDKLGLSKAYVF